jgi:hypothetical protein
MNLPSVLSDPLFDLFWSKYPNKVAKLAAQKAWKKLAPNREDVVSILEKLEKQKSSRMWQEGIGIPYPSTYLNQARFLDEPIEEDKKSAPQWWTSNDLMLAKGKELGTAPRPGEDWNQFKARLSTMAVSNG